MSMTTLAGGHGEHFCNAARNTGELRNVKFQVEGRERAEGGEGKQKRHERERGRRDKKEGLTGGRGRRKRERETEGREKKRGE
jgi:hypothetical protein